jgi:hypothetical protein
MTESTSTNPKGGAMRSDHDGGRRALLVANEAVVGNELRDSLLEHLGDEVTRVFVVCPALAGSAIEHIMGDVDSAIGPAGERLQQTLEVLQEAGVQASGEVGDSDPIQAISDEIVKFEPDEILVIAHRDADGAFAEKDLLEQAQRNFEMPVLELVVSADPRPRVLDVKETEPAAESKKGWRPSYNFPPLSRRDLAGIAVAVLGTLVLGILAAKCVANTHSPSGDHEEGRLGLAAAACVLIALAMALINLAHVVGLFLFQSVNYKGIWRHFFARLSLYGTPLAIVVALVLVSTTT